MSNVEHPKHYNLGGIECIEAMRQCFGDGAVADFCKLNAFKYLWRCGAKGKETEDIAKAHYYLGYYLKMKGETDVDVR